MQMEVDKMVTLKRIARALCFITIGIVSLPLRIVREVVDLVLDVSIDIRDALAGDYD